MNAQLAGCPTCHQTFRLGTRVGAKVGGLLLGAAVGGATKRPGLMLAASVLGALIGDRARADPVGDGFGRPDRRGEVDNGRRDLLIASYPDRVAQAAVSMAVSNHLEGAGAAIPLRFFGQRTTVPWWLPADRESR